MRAKVVPVFTLIVTAGLLIWAGAQAATTAGGQFADPTSAAIATPHGNIQLAGSPKLGEKYLEGKAGGRYGIGGTDHSRAKNSKPKDSKAKAKDGNKGDATSLGAKPAP